VEEPPKGHSWQTNRDGLKAQSLSFLMRDSCNRSTMNSLSSSINTLMLSQRLHIEGMRHGMGFGSGAMRMSHEANIGGAGLDQCSPD